MMQEVKGYTVDKKFYTYKRINWTAYKESIFLQKLLNLVRARHPQEIKTDFSHTEYVTISSPKLITLAEAKRDELEIIELYFSPMDEKNDQGKTTEGKTGLWKKRES